MAARMHGHHIPRHQRQARHKHYTKVLMHVITAINICFMTHHNNTCQAASTSASPDASAPATTDTCQAASTSASPDASAPATTAGTSARSHAPSTTHASPANAAASTCTTVGSAAASAKHTRCATQSKSPCSSCARPRCQPKASSPCSSSARACLCAWSQAWAWFSKSLEACGDCCVGGWGDASHDDSEPVAAMDVGK